MDWLTHIVFWHWWILAGMLLILELTWPLFFFLWLGFSAATVGFLLLVFPETGVAVQMVMFGALSVVAVLAWRKYRQARPAVPGPSTQNQRGQQYTGRILTLDDPIIDGIGKVRVDDSVWRVTGPDLPAGAQVRVVGVDGIDFIVEGADPTG